MLISYEDSPELALSGETVTFALRWRGDPDAVRAVICETNQVDDGACPGGTWTVGGFSASNPALARYQTPKEAADTYKYFPFVCDASGACSEPIHTSPTECAYFSFDPEPGPQGPYSCDQSPATGDETNEPPPAAPTPISGITGSPKTSGFTTEVWGEGATDVRHGLRVIASTAPGTYALTGGVIDWDTGGAIVDALVFLETAQGVSVRARTDDDGAFAFIDVPVDRGERLVLTVRAAGYKLHRVAQETYPDTFVVTAELEPSG